MTETDAIEEFYGSTIQHGRYNDRIYLMKMTDESDENFPGKLIQKAERENYSKIFAKIPESRVSNFLEFGYKEEARIPKFYSGQEAAAFLGYYLSTKRSVEENAEQLDSVLRLAEEKASSSKKPLADIFKLRSCSAEDVAIMAEIYKEVFPSYPFPIHSPEYLLKTMRSHVDYFGIEAHGKLVALSSAEMDKSAANVEMTDFATLPDWRGHGFGVHLLEAMEEAMQLKNMKTTYTIARAVSPGMNITFAKLGYRYGGRLKNNTNISGQIESMNIWYKHF